MIEPWMQTLLFALVIGAVVLSFPGYMAANKLSSLISRWVGRRPSSPSLPASEQNDRIGMLRATIQRQKQTIATLNERNSKLKEKIAELRESYRNARSDAHRQQVDPIEHNTSTQMDVFFAEVRDPTPYQEFGTALRKQIGDAGIVLDGKIVCDAGMGPGIAFASVIEGTTPRSVHGLDFSAAAVEHARKVLPPGAELGVASLYDPLPSKYDVVFCTEVLEHLERPSLAVKNLLNAVVPGGWLILTVPDGRVDFSRYHINFWSPESFRFFVEDFLGSADTVRFGQFRIRETANYENNLALIKIGDKSSGDAV